MRIVGTAGHVDHGKSSLVISLTGHNPDRWVEERERGMTLDLGFAPLRFDDGLEAGIIDVPGHERFIHNMLAGAAGVDVLLLVVDALEGPRAQTLEHLEILNFLNVARAIVVVTKADLVDDATLARTADDVRIATAGTIAQDAPVIAVSNVTGAGIEQLKAAIHGALVALPPPRTDAPAFLPIDRVFALPGHGTIVTGTLMQGTLRAGDTLALQPSGVAARVRSLQTFGRKIDEALAGARVAANIPGIDASVVRRGDVLAARSEFEPMTKISIEFTPLARALPLLRRRTPVRVHVGAAEIEGRLYFEQRPTDERATRGSLVLSGPTVVYAGSRLIVRRLSPKELLGGGVVLGGTYISASAAEGDYADNPVLAAIEAAGLTPMPLRKIAAAANVREEVAAAAIEVLVADGCVVALAKPVEYIGRGAFEAAFARASDALRARHTSAPWRLGCSTTEIAAAVGVGDAVTLRLLAAWHDDGRIGYRARYWYAPDFTPSLSKEQRAFFDGALTVDAAAPLTPASHDAVMAAADERRIPGVRDAFETLVAAGALVRIGDDVYRRGQMDRAQAIVADVLKGGGATTSQVRTALGVSRKYALPLLEHFDSAGLTVRDGDLRRLRARAGKPALETQTT